MFSAFKTLLSGSDSRSHQPVQQSYDDQYLVRRAASYVTLIFSCPGLKALLVDDVSIQILSRVLNSRQLAEREVVMTISLESELCEVEDHLQLCQGIVLIRPTHESVALLTKHLFTPEFLAYDVYFTNTPTTDMIEMIAAADTEARVRKVAAIPLDWFLDSQTLCFCSSRSWSQPDRMCRRASDLDRLARSAIAVCINYEARPVALYPKFCDDRASAITVARTIHAGPLPFDVQLNHTMPVLVFDRGMDIITPLLLPFSYRAMMEEYLQIENGKVAFEIVELDRPQKLSTVTDPFLYSTQFLEFGDVVPLLLKFKDQVENIHESVGSTDGSHRNMLLFAELGEYRRIVGLHTAIANELDSKAIGLLPLAQLMVSISSGITYRAISSDLSDCLENGAFEEHYRDCVRVLAHYAFGSDVAHLQNSASRRIIEHLDRIRTDSAASLHQQSGFSIRSIDFLGVLDSSSMSSHIPRVAKMAANILHARYSQFHLGERLAAAPTGLVVVMTGGATYTEYRALYELAAAQNKPIILLCDKMLNTRSFTQPI